MGSIIALDVGTVRIGVAIANTIARLPSAHMTLTNDEQVIDKIVQMIQSESVERIVVGLPRNLSGEDTDQTRYCRAFADKLRQYSTIEFQDEALTSAQAEAELKRRGKPYQKGDIDALAAVYILDDYLKTM